MLLPAQCTRYHVVLVHQTRVHLTSLSDTLGFTPLREVYEGPNESGHWGLRLLLTFLLKCPTPSQLNASAHLSHRLAPHPTTKGSIGLFRIFRNFQHTSLLCWSLALNPFRWVPSARLSRLRSSKIDNCIICMTTACPRFWRIQCSVNDPRGDFVPYWGNHTMLPLDNRLISPYFLKFERILAKLLKILGYIFLKIYCEI